MKTLNIEEIQKQVLSSSDRLIGLSPSAAVNLLCRFAKSDNYELRIGAIEKMAKYKKYKITLCLIDFLCKEKDSLILIATMETISTLKIRSAIKPLLKKLHHKDYMVRGYAAITLSNISKKITLRYLSKLVKKEHSSWTKAVFYIALYTVGNYNVLNNLLCLLKSKRYRVRSVIVNSLPDMELGGNKDFVISVLKDRLKTEKTVAVSSSIENTLKILEQKNKKSKK